jgi:hypothetical protein
MNPVRALAEELSCIVTALGQNVQVPDGWGID